MNDIHLIKVPECREAFSAGVTACAIQIRAISVDRGLHTTDDWRQVTCADCRDTIVYREAAWAKTTTSLANKMNEWDSE